MLQVCSEMQAHLRSTFSQIPSNQEGLELGAPAGLLMATRSPSLKGCTANRKKPARQLHLRVLPQWAAELINMQRVPPQYDGVMRRSRFNLSNCAAWLANTIAAAGCVQSGIGAPVRYCMASIPCTWLPALHDAVRHEQYSWQCHAG